MKGQRKRLPVADQIRKGLEEAIRHANGEITLKTTTLEQAGVPKVSHFLGRSGAPGASPFQDGETVQQPSIPPRND
jgi:hypothetical protein